MPKLKSLAPKQLVSIVEKLGYRFVRQKGSHASHANSRGEIVVICGREYCWTERPADERPQLFLQISGRGYCAVRSQS